MPERDALWTAHYMMPHQWLVRDTFLNCRGIKKMMRLILLSITVLMSLLATFADAAEWSVGWSGTDGRFQQLDMAGEKDYQFVLDRFLCKVSKITLANVQNEVFERRTVACQVSKDTYVSTDLSFNINGKTCTDTQSLTIYDKDEIHIASLFVKCK
jgi:hypothetical protein